MSKITRREMLRLTGAGIVLNSLGGCSKPPEIKTISLNSDQPIVTPQGRILPLDAAPLEKQILYEAANEPRHLDISRDIYGAGVAIN